MVVLTNVLKCVNSKARGQFFSWQYTNKLFLNESQTTITILLSYHVIGDINLQIDEFDIFILSTTDTISKTNLKSSF